MEVEVTQNADTLAGSDKAPEPRQPARRLPFAFAKRHGVFVEDVEADEPIAVFREDTQPSSIAEVRRVLGRRLKLRRRWSRDSRRKTTSSGSPRT